jgi:oxygen-independent coproporphyrinogen-3 oxidase
MTTLRRPGQRVRHIYVHIPFCARICPYCAFYKERADPALATRFAKRCSPS